MRFVRLLPIFLLALTSAIVVGAQAPAAGGGQGGAPRAGGGGGPQFNMMMEFPDGAELPQKNSGLGMMLSPKIDWVNPPKGTVSFVLSMNDIDFSRNKTMEGMLHWLVWNIPASATGLPEGLPMGPLANGGYQISASGQMYRAPVGPGRKHHYIFELMALDTMLDVKPSDMPFETRAAVFKGSEGHIVGKIAWVTTFGPNNVQPAPVPAR